MGVPARPRRAGRLRGALRRGPGPGPSGDDARRPSVVDGDVSVGELVDAPVRRRGRRPARRAAAGRGVRRPRAADLPRGPPCRSWWPTPSAARCSSRRRRIPTTYDAPGVRGHPGRHGPAARDVGRLLDGSWSAPAPRCARSAGRAARASSWSSAPPRARDAGGRRGRAGHARRPGRPAARRARAGGRARSWPAIESASMAVVTLAFRGARPSATCRAPASWCRPSTGTGSRRRRSPSPSGTGSVRPAGGRGRPDVLLLRTSLGRHREEVALQATDEELVAVSLADLAAGDRRSRRARSTATCSAGAAACRSTPSATSTGSPGSAPPSPGVPGLAVVRGGVRRGRHPRRRSPRPAGRSDLLVTGQNERP